MLGDLIPMVVCTGMFALIFGVVYIRSRENMAIIEKGMNPRMKDTRPRPFINLKWGLLLIGSGMGLLLAYMIDYTILKDKKQGTETTIALGHHHNYGKHVSVTNVTVTTDTAHSAKDTSLAAQNAAKNANAADDGDDNEEEHSVAEIRNNDPENVPLYFALIAIGGGLGLFFSYRIEKKEWLDKKMDA